MAKLYLRRFSTLENYQNAVIEDGTFFVIVESGQLGVRKGELDILTPSNTLRDYKLPEGDVVITSNDTIVSINQNVIKDKRQIKINGSKTKYKRKESHCQQP